MIEFHELKMWFGSHVLAHVIGSNSGSTASLLPVSHGKPLPSRSRLSARHDIAGHRFCYEGNTALKRIVKFVNSEPPLFT